MNTKKDYLIFLFLNNLTGSVLALHFRKQSQHKLENALALLKETTLLPSSNMKLHTRIQQPHIFCKICKIMIYPITAMGIDKLTSCFLLQHIY